MRSRSLTGETSTQQHNSTAAAAAAPVLRRQLSSEQPTSQHTKQQQQQQPDAVGAENLLLVQLEAGGDEQGVDWGATQSSKTDKYLASWGEPGFEPAPSHKQPGQQQQQRDLSMALQNSSSVGVDSSVLNMLVRQMSGSSCSVDAAAVLSPQQHQLALQQQQQQTLLLRHGKQLLSSAVQSGSGSGSGSSAADRLYNIQHSVHLADASQQALQALLLEQQQLL
jgi:hypothetical protein